MGGTEPARAVPRPLLDSSEAVPDDDQPGERRRAPVSPQQVVVQGLPAVHHVEHRGLALHVVFPLLPGKDRARHGPAPSADRGQRVPAVSSPHSRGSGTAPALSAPPPPALKRPGRTGHSGRAAPAGTARRERDRLSANHPRCSPQSRGSPAARPAAAAGRRAGPARRGSARSGPARSTHSGRAARRGGSAGPARLLRAAGSARRGRGWLSPLSPLSPRPPRPALTGARRPEAGAQQIVPAGQSAVSAGPGRGHTGRGRALTAPLAAAAASLRSRGRLPLPLHHYHHHPYPPPGPGPGPAAAARAPLATRPPPPPCARSRARSRDRGRARNRRRERAGGSPGASRSIPEPAGASPQPWPAPPRPAPRPGEPLPRPEPRPRSPVPREAPPAPRPSLSPVPGELWQPPGLSCVCAHCGAVQGGPGAGPAPRGVLGAALEPTFAPELGSSCGKTPARGSFRQELTDRTGWKVLLNRCIPEIIIRMASHL